MEMVVGMALSFLLVGFGYVTVIHGGDDDRVDDEFGHIEDREEREAERDRAQLERMLERGRAAGHDWGSDASLGARAMEVGPREASEVVCMSVANQKDIDEWPEEILGAMLESLQEREDSAPWTCAMTLYFEGSLEARVSVEEAVEAMWGQAQELTGGTGPIMSSVLEALVTTDIAFEHEEFDRWVRRCALSFDYEAAPMCRQVARRQSPAMGADLLEMAIGHLEDEELRSRDIDRVAAALGAMVTHGQPPQWTVEETDALPDYDVDLRFGALFKLCRLMNSPDEEVQQLAARELGKLSGIGGRPTSRNMHFRWRATCRSVFNEEQDSRLATPILGVMTDEEDESQVDYGLSTLIERGRCEVWEGAPDWYCGARAYQGSGEDLRRYMGDAFAHTSDIEWVVEPEPVADSVEDGEGD